MAERVRVLIVDDSPTIRRLVRLALSSDPRIDIVGDAQDPFDARAKIKSLSPDVLTLDVEMPQMNGLDFLERLMRLRPMPVVMLSTLTHGGSAAAVAALSLGAVECVGKPDGAQRARAFAGLAELGGGGSAGPCPRAVAGRTGCRACGGGQLSLEPEDRPDRGLDRGCRGAGNRSRPAARGLPADPDHPAHACGFSGQLCRPSDRPNRAEGRSCHRRGRDFAGSDF